MIDELPYKNKFELLSPWNKEMIVSIKKEVKTELTKKDSILTQRLFDRKKVDKLSMDEMAALCIHKVIETGDEELGEWIVSRWVFKHAEIYQFFAQELSAINPKFDEIEVIELSKEKFLLTYAIEHFGAIDSYIFCVLNSVVLSKEAEQSLKAKAEEELREKKAREEKMAPVLSMEEVKQKYEAEILKLTDKYEKRLLGVARKHQVDVEGFRKQISQLQRKLEEVRIGAR